MWSFFPFLLLLLLCLGLCTSLSLSPSLPPSLSLSLTLSLSLSLSLSPKLRTFSKCSELAYRRKNSGLGPEYRFLSSILCGEIGQLAARVTVLFS